MAPCKNVRYTLTYIYILYAACLTGNCVYTYIYYMTWLPGRRGMPTQRAVHERCTAVTAAKEETLGTQHPMMHTRFLPVRCATYVHTTCIYVRTALPVRYTPNLRHTYSVFTLTGAMSINILAGHIHEISQANSSQPHGCCTRSFGMRFACVVPITYVSVSSLADEDKSTCDAG